VLIVLIVPFHPPWASATQSRELLAVPIDPFGVPGFIRLLHDAEADELILAATPRDLRSTAYDHFFSTWEVSAPQGVETQPSPPVSLSTFGPWSETIRHPVSGHYRVELILERPRPDGGLEASRRFTMGFFYNAVAATAELDTEVVTKAIPKAGGTGSLRRLGQVGGLEIVQAEAVGLGYAGAVPGLFRPEARAVSIDFSWRGARPGTTLTATWFYIEGRERVPWLTQKRVLTSDQGRDSFRFIIDEDEQWFVGDYVVELASGGQTLKEVYFGVRPGRAPGPGRPLVVVALTVAASGTVPQPAGPGAVVPPGAQRVEIRAAYRGGVSGQRLTSRWFFVQAGQRRLFSESAVDILRPDHEVAFSFQLEPRESWLPGSYEVDIFAGQELVARATFHVREPAGLLGWPALEPARVALRPDPVAAGEECIVEGRGFTPNGFIPLEGIVLVDALGRKERFRGEPIRLSAQGTFALRFRLPVTTPPGEAYLEVTDQARRRARVSFRVTRPKTIKEKLEEIERAWKEVFK
jgi:hypothetical protein